LKKLRTSIRVKTKRTNGHSLDCIIADVDLTLVGWLEYFQHSHYYVFYIFERVRDGVCVRHLRDK